MCISSGLLTDEKQDKEVLSKEETGSREEVIAVSHSGSSRGQAKVEVTIGVHLGDVWSRKCTLNQDGKDSRRIPLEMTTKKRGRMPRGDEVAGH